MRAGAYTIHQSLTAEAAAVLKLALALARRRGHAQVTPLHVAFALLTGPTATCAQPFSTPASSPAAPYGLLKRACLRSHTTASSPGAHQHPLQCRALELCFNVALNRLPTSGAPPTAHFASPLIQPSPTLSNALVAALKRAQANQRRGCVELQHQPPPPPPAATPQQQQPLLAIKVELDQLVISILDDPSVSRVMREAGFSSSTVKSNLEEESALMPPPPPSSSSSSPPPPPPPIPPHFFLDPSSIAGGNGAGKGVGRMALWPAQFLASPASSTDACSDDVRAVLEVMVRKEGRRSNPVVVGDSVSMAEAVAGEVLRRLERGDVPVELAGAHLLKLQLSYVHVRLMSRADVEARAAELRRSVDAVQLLHRGGGLVVYVGDLRWALDEEPPAMASSYSPVEHMVAELGRLLDDLRASRGRAWLVATASYQTYMRWQQQRRRRPVDSAWAMQAVVVPTGSGTGLALNSLHSSSSSIPSASAAPVPPAMATAQQLLGHASPFAMVAGEPTAFSAAGDELDETQLLLCTECSKNYEREASLVKAEAGVEGPRGSLPAWLALDRPPADQMPHHKEKYLMELKRKWSRLCRKLHLCASSDPYPWWSGSCFLTGSQSKPSVAAFLGFDGLMEHGNSRTTGQWSPPSPPLPRWGLSPAMAAAPVTATALALGSHPLSDSATSDGRAPVTGDASSAARELERTLRRNIPWHPGAVASEITEAVVAGGKMKGVWLLVKGSDHAGARRVAMVIAEARCGERVIWADPSRFSCAEEMCSDVVSRAAEMGGGGKTTSVVVVVDDVENAPCDVVDCLVAASRRDSFKDHLSGQELDLSSSVVILTTFKLTVVGAGDVIGLRLWSEDEASSDGPKRKTESSPPSECKRARHDALDLNLNLRAEEDADDEDDDGSDNDDEAVPSDITHEGDSGESSEHGSPDGLLESIATRVVTLDEEEGGRDAAAAAIRGRLAGAMAGHGRARVDEAAVQALAAASGHFLEEVLERWATEVLGPAVATVRDGGKGNELVVVLGLGGSGGARDTAGFMGSVLPSRVHVD